jgi:Icc-related predicted phosphoesterase
MRTTTISDTHSAHSYLKLSGGDVLIHAGDLCNRGTEMEVIDFLNWFEKQDYQYKIFIAGNHDFYFESESREDIYNLIPSNITYLNDNSVKIEGMKIWGSPITPYFFNWAFNRHRGTEIIKHWELIPDDVDVLITHGPPFGILDMTTDKTHAGCADLMNKIEKINPRYHIFGHIHEGYGIHKTEKTTYINSSIMDSRYNLVNQPINIDL